MPFEVPRFRHYCLLRGLNACNLEMVLVALNYVRPRRASRKVCVQNLDSTPFEAKLSLTQRFFDDVHFLDSRDCFLWWNSSIARARGSGVFFLYLQFKGWITSYTGLSHHQPTGKSGNLLHSASNDQPSSDTQGLGTLERSERAAGIGV